MKKLQLPLSEADIRSLTCGETVLLSGRVLTGRDAAHKRMVNDLQNGKPLPFEIKGASIYYVGPAPASPGHAVGPAGPTTSYRMDAYTPFLLQRGLKVMIGKGDRSPEVIEGIKKHTAVYFAAVGGAAALLSRHIVSARVLLYEDLGTEAVHEFCLDEFPAVVAIDAAGNDIYTSSEFR